MLKTKISTSIFARDSSEQLPQLSRQLHLQLESLTNPPVCPAERGIEVDGSKAKGLGLSEALDILVR